MRLPRVPADMPPPPGHWWGNAFYRVWAGWEQLVIVLRLPWWSECYDLSVIGPGFLRKAQLVVSWRRREGWRKGWMMV